MNHNRMKGFFGIGIQNTKTKMNVGTLWRTAYQLGASFIFTIGKRYKPQNSDTVNAFNKIPLYNYVSFDDFFNSIPYNCRLVGVETSGVSITDYTHPKTAIYLLGAEDNGLTKTAIEKCHQLVKLPSVRTESYNVAVAGALVMYDRLMKQ